MRAEIKVAFITYDPAQNTMLVLIDGDNLPGRSISLDSPEEAIDKICSRFIDIESKFIPFELSSYTFDKAGKKLTLYFYAFLPSPVPNKRGDWAVTWEVFRDNEKVFNVIQECTTKAFKLIQTQVTI